MGAARLPVRLIAIKSDDGCPMGHRASTTRVDTIRAAPTFAGRPRS
jgi:hypothetical protein